MLFVGRSQNRIPTPQERNSDARRGNGNLFRGRCSGRQWGEAPAGTRVDAAQTQGEDGTRPSQGGEDAATQDRRAAAHEGDSGNRGRRTYSFSQEEGRKALQEGAEEDRRFLTRRTGPMHSMHRSCIHY